MGRSKDGTEILVHITAPSAAADDVKYRALAQAYLDFEPERTVPLPQGSTSNSRAVPSDNKFISPQASFGSVWDNIGSPRLARAIQPSAELPGIQPSVPAVSSQLDDDTQHSWVAPPSEIPDSMPDNDIRAPAFNTPTRILNYFLQSTEPPLLSSGGRSSEAVEVGRNAVHSTPSHAADLDSLLGCESALDSSPSTRRPRSRAPQSPGPVKTVLSVQEVTEACAADHGLQCPALADKPEAQQAAKADTLSGKQLAVLLATSDWAHETQLVSHEPAAANNRLGPRAPQHLEKLATSMQMDKKYRPEFQAREMRPFERGYWLMGLDGWEFEEKVKAWGFLGNFIRRDSKAGWGTRACRDESWGWIRLYGWEHIAAELYTLLYVASYRKLKFVETKFYGAAGDVLIVVGPRGTRSKSG
ncbi:hypothetical protein KVR01_004935 [Diaporthe batatas]|uniref:uncharacterized protein n=1 Tax=Diaporthe batatas TaxID=748121 RepID=UPI001D04D3D0|nr:uncharacterized protein KVR01_004935 [Diaporthe batatas]KAG8164660.1 hypothetical protein KVR01_004935 [Diaporthe batatas]